MNPRNVYYDNTPPPTPEVRAIACDRLEINILEVNLPHIEEEDIEARPGIHLIGQIRKSRAFETVARVYMDGEEIGELEYNSRSERIKPMDAATFRLANNLLYADGWRDIPIQFIERIGAKFDCIRMIDVACDGFNILEPIRQHYGFGRARHRCQSDMNPYYQKDHLVGAYIGSRKSDVFGRAYRKSQEIDKHSKKLYIQQWHEANGMEEGNVERLEFQLRTKILDRLGFFRTIQGYYEATSYKGLLSLAGYCTEKYFQFVDRATLKSNISRAARVCKVAFFDTWEMLKKSKAIASRKVRMVQTTMKTLFQLAKQTGWSKFRELSFEMAQSSGMVKWHSMKRTEWDKECERAAKNGRDIIPVYAVDGLDEPIAAFQSMR